MLGVYIGCLYVCVCVCVLTVQLIPKLSVQSPLALVFINHALSTVSGLVQKFAGVHQLMTMLMRK